MLFIRKQPKLISVSQRVLFMYRVPMRSLKATTEGVVPDNSDINKIGEGYVDKNVKELSLKLDEFNEKLEEVPNYITDPEKNKKIVNDNDKKIYLYAKDQISKVFGVPKDAVEVIFDVKLTTNEVDLPYTNWFKNNAKILARGKYRYFLDTVKYKVQQKREIDQQLKGLDITLDEFKDVKVQLLRRSFILQVFSQKTNDRDYINNVSKFQKLEDINALKAKLKEYSSPLADISQLTYNDMPLFSAAKVIKAFELNPTDVKNIEAIDKALLSFKNDLIKIYRSNPSGFNLNDSIGKLV